MSLSLKKEDYNKSKVTKDLLAGLTVAVMLVPQGMAYALLAGLPPIYGLYAALVPLLIYPFFGSSEFLSVGPVALVSIIVLSSLSELAAPMSQEFIQLAILTSLVAGVIQLALAIFRMGFLVNFLSHPVIIGFTSAAAVIIALSQLKYVLGVEFDQNSNVVQLLYSIFENLDALNIIALAMGLAGIVIILTLKKVKKGLPTALIVVILSIILVKFGSLDSMGLDIVKEVPAGLPTFSLPDITLANIQKVLPVALIICLISFIESLSIAKTLGAKNGHFDTDANRELLGLGMAKIVGSFFQAFPNTGSFTRSAINEQAGAKTGLSSIFASFFIGLTLIFFTSFFYYLPKAILAAIVISAVFGLINIKEARHLYMTHKRDFIVLMITFLATLFLGIEQGVFLGIALSLIFILSKVSKPHYAVLGKLPETDVYRNFRRFDEAETANHRIIFRYDEDIFFGNADHFYDSIMHELDIHPDTDELLLDFSSVSNMDSSGYMKLELLLNMMKSNNIDVHISGIKGPVRDFLKKNDILNIIEAENMHWDIPNAISNINNGNT